VYIIYINTVPNLAPLNLTVSPESSTSIRLRWELPPFEGRNGIIRGFQITVVNNGSVMSFTTASDTNELLVEDLIKFTTYLCSVLSFTTVGNGPSTQLMTATTFQDGMFHTDVILLSTSFIFVP